MVIDERRPDRIEFGALDSGIDCPNAGHSPLQRDRGGRNVAEGGPHRPQSRRRADHRPAKTGRSSLRVLWNHATADSRMAERNEVAALGAPAHIRQFLSVPTLGRRQRSLSARALSARKTIPPHRGEVVGNKSCRKTPLSTL